MKPQGNSEKICFLIFYSSNLLHCISSLMVEKVCLYQSLCCHVEAYLYKFMFLSVLQENKLGNFCTL